jgi:hypothetical protein
LIPNWRITAVGKAEIVESLWNVNEDSSKTEMAISISDQHARHESGKRCSRI